LRDDDLMRTVDGDLRVVALDHAIASLLDAAVGIGEVALRPVGRPAVGRPVRLAVVHHAGGRARPVVIGGRRFRLGLERRLCLTQALEPLLLVGDPIRHLVAAHRPVRPILLGIGRFGARKPRLHLGLQLRFRLAHPPAAHRLVLGGVRLDLRPVERHVPKLHRPRLPAQAQHLNEKIARRLQMPPAKLRDRAEVGPAHPGHRHEVHPLLTRALQLPRRVDVPAVAVEQQRHHHRRMLGRIAPLLAAAGEDPPRSSSVRTVSRTKCATCFAGTKSWTDGGNSHTWSTFHGRRVLLMPVANHDPSPPSSKTRLLRQAPRPRPGSKPNLTPSTDDGVRPEAGVRHTAVLPRTDSSRHSLLLRQ
jgi:hypothetical protein